MENRDRIPDLVKKGKEAMRGVLILLSAIGLLGLVSGCQHGVCDCDREQLPPQVVPHVGHFGQPAPIISTSHRMPVSDEPPQAMPLADEQ